VYGKPFFDHESFRVGDNLALSWVSASDFLVVLAVLDRTVAVRMRELAVVFRGHSTFLFSLDVIDGDGANMYPSFTDATPGSALNCLS
jgi:hypothetical protein